MPKDPGQAFSSMLRKRAEGVADSAVRTGSLYSMPRIGDRLSEKWAPECITWPRYNQGTFSMASRLGVSMLELTQEERLALRIVVLRTNVKKEKFGAPHYYNWKKVGLSTAYYREERIKEENMPTPRAKAAFAYLLSNNKYYKAFLICTMVSLIVLVYARFPHSIFSLITRGSSVPSGLGCIQTQNSATLACIRITRRRPGMTPAVLYPLLNLGLGKF